MKRIVAILVLLSCFYSIILAQTYIREGSNVGGSVMYSWDGRTLRQGTNGQEIINYDGRSIRQGYNSLGTVLYSWDGKFLKQGIAGKEVLNWDGRYIRQGYNLGGVVSYNWDGKYLRESSNNGGSPICNVSGPIPVPVLMVILL